MPHACWNYRTAVLCLSSRSGDLNSVLRAYTKLFAAWPISSRGPSFYSPSLPLHWNTDFTSRYTCLEESTISNMVFNVKATAAPGTSTLLRLHTSQLIISLAHVRKGSLACLWAWEVSHHGASAQEPISTSCSTQADGDQPPPVLALLGHSHSSSLSLPWFPMISVVSKVTSTCVTYTQICLQYFPREGEQTLDHCASLQSIGKPICVYCPFYTSNWLPFGSCKLVF